MTKRLGLIVCILIVLMSAGCWNKKEPKELAIINSIIYDKQDDGQCKVIVEFLDLKAANQKGEASGKSFSVQTALGITYREALANVSFSIDKTIYGGHNHVRFFTESAARDGLADTLDYLLRDHLADETPLVVVLQAERPEAVYGASIGLSDSVGVYIDSMELTQKNSTSQSVFVSTLDFTKDFFDDGKEPVAGFARIVTESPSGGQSDGAEESRDRIVYEGLAAFKGDALVGFFDGPQTRAYHLITGNFGYARISIPYESSYIVCEVTDASSDITTQIDGKTAAIGIKIKTKFRVLGVGADRDPRKLDVMREMENSFNEYLLPEIAAAVEKAQREFGSDIFGFGAKVHAQNPQAWKEIKHEWNDIFSSATVTISIESTMFQTGEIKNSVLSEFSEE